MLQRNPLTAQRPAAARRILPVVLLLAATMAVPAAGRRIPIDPSQPHLAKASGRLLAAHKLALAGKSPQEIQDAISGLPLVEGRADVEITFASLTPGQAAALERLGIRVRSSHPTYRKVYGRLDPARLTEITALPEVLAVRPTPRVGRRAGAAVNRGDLAMKTDKVRMPPLSLTGTGVTVGILSDSYNDSLGGSESGGTCTCDLVGSTCANLVTGMANQTSGDLPASVGILDDCDDPLNPNCSFLIDEGAALGEHVMDVAPGSGQLFHSAFGGPADFAEGIIQLVNCGADVVVDDVFYTAQPFFQDGDIAAAAQNAVDLGVPYFSAAGNDATFGIHDVYTDANEPVDNTVDPPNGDDFHAFAPGDSYAAITLPDDCEIVAELQWSEPFPGPGVGASSDLDLYILNSPDPPSTVGETNVLNDLASFEGIEPQGCSVSSLPFGFPLEIVDYTNTTGGLQTVYLAVEHYCGDETVDLRIVNLSFNCDPSGPGWNFEDGGPGENPIFVDPQIFGHPAARGAVAVGAAFYGEIIGLPNFPPGDSDPPDGQFDVEAFSSLGGDLPFFFDALGNPAPETRFKPEITAPDGGNTTFFGFDIFGTGVDEPDTDPNFFGTSAAAPNAAGLAALVLEETGNNITPKALVELLKQSALDIETMGPDDLSGFGFLDGEAAIKSLNPTVPPILTDLEFDLDGGAFLKTPPATPGTLQRLEALDTLTLGDGDFSGLFGVADTLIFTNGFESGDVSAWSNSSP